LLLQRIHLSRGVQQVGRNRLVEHLTVQAAQGGI
jgi:hypothetical protein